MEVFKLLGTISIDPKAAEAAIDKIRGKAEGLSEKLKSGGDTLAKWGGALTKTVTVAGGAIGTAAIKSAMTFEDSMAKIDTIANLTAGNAEVSYGQMKKAIMDLSNQTGVSASDIANNVYDAISSGQSVGDAVNFVSNSTKLAKAGFAETGQSLDILTTILNAYGMEASDVTKVSDILIQTQNLGKTTVGELSSTMGKVIPTAKTYNVSLEQVASGYSIMTSKGIATAETTTYMNSMFNELGKSGTTVSDVLKEKTGKSFTDLMAEGYTLGDCLQIIGDSAEEQGLSFMDMWGSAEAAKAGVTLLGANSSVFNDQLKKMSAGTGSTDAAFAKLDTTSLKLSKVLNQGKNTFIDLGGTILEMLLPYLEKGAEKVKQFATWFNNLDEGTKKTIITIAGMAIALGPVLGLVGKVTSGIGGLISVGSTIIKGIGILVPVVAGIGAPVLIVIGVIAALIAVGVLLYKNWDEIKEFGSRAWDAITGFIGAAAEKISGFFSGIFNFIKDNWQGLALFLVNPFVGGFKLLYDNCEGFRQFIDGFLTGVKDLFGGMVTSVKEKALELKTDVSDKMSELKENVLNKITELKDSAAAKWTDIVETATSKWNEAKESVTQAAEEMKEKASAKLTEMKDKCSSAMAELKEKIVTEATQLKDKATDKFQELKEKSMEKIDSLKSRATEDFEILRNKSSESIENLKKAAIDKFGVLKDAATEKVRGLKDAAISIFNNLKNGIQDHVSNIQNAVVQGFDNAVNYIKNLASEAWTWGLDMVSGVADGIMSGIKYVTSAVTKVADKIKSFLHFSVPDEGPLTEYESWMPDFMKGLADGINSNKKLVKEAVKGLASDMVFTQDVGIAQTTVPPQSFRKSAQATYTDRSAVGIAMDTQTIAAAIISGLNGARVVLSTGETIGALAVPMNEALGKIARKKERG